MMKKVVFFSTIILILCFSSCISFASLSYEKFENIMTNSGYEISSTSTSINSITESLSYDNLWIYKYEANVNYIYILHSNYDNNYNLYYDSGYKYIRIKRDFNDDLYTKDNKFTNNIITLDIWGTDYTNNYGPNFLIYDKSFPPLSENSELTVDEFKSFNYLKRLLLERTYYLDKDLYYEGQVILTPEEVYNYRNGIIEPEEPTPDVSTLFDGVFTGNESQKPYTSNFYLNEDMLRFDYTAYTDLNNSNVTNYFYLQEFSPEVAVRLTEKDFNFSESDLFITENRKLESNFSFDYLKRRMKDGYIYRLLCFSNQNNESGEFLRVADSTSCFFSLNSWDSNVIKVVNLNDYLGVSSGTIIPLPDVSGDSSGDTSGEKEFDIQDGFSNINDSINNLNNNINNTILGTLNDSGEREGGLVGNLLSGLWKGIVSLIIPSNEQFGEWITNTYEDVNSRGGILLYSKEFWISLLGLINNDETKDLIFNFPEFNIPTSNVTIFEETSFNVNEFIEQHDSLKTFYSIYIVIISGISIYYFCQYLWSLWQALINGTGSVEVTQNQELDGWNVGQYGNVKMGHYKTNRNIKFK